jgi:hypothetical protein
VVADARGHFGDVTLDNNPYLSNVRPLVTEYTLMAGGQARFYRKENYALSAHVLGGMALGEFDGGTHGIPAPAVGMWPTGKAAAASGGVNLDYNLYPNLALRLTPYILYTNFGSYNQINKGLNAQLVFRFGRQKGGLK